MDRSIKPTDRQMELLKKEDWRFHAVDFAGTGLCSITTTESIAGKNLSFSLPSAPALFLSLARNAYHKRVSIPLDSAFIQHPSPQGTWPEDHRDVFDFFEAFLAEIIFAFTAIEAFANESIPPEFKYSRTRKGEEEILQGAEIETSISLDDKLKRVIPQAHNIASAAGTTAWNKYIEMKRIRDRLVHLKAIDRKSSGPAHQTIWGLLITKRDRNFADVALGIIAAYPSLVENRRWFKLARAQKKTQQA